MTLGDFFPVLKTYPPELVQRWFDLIARQAPAVAAEPLVVGSILVGLCAIQHVDVKWMIELLELNQRMVSHSTH